MRKEITERINAINQKKIVNLKKLSIIDIELPEIIDEIKKYQPDVISILLCDNNITDLGAELLGQKLSDLPKLSFLDLQHNVISIKGVENLFKMIKNLSNLEIALQGNANLNAYEVNQLQEKYLSKPGVRLR